MNRIIKILFVVAIVGIIIILFSNTFAYKDNKITEIFYTDDYDKLENDLYNYIDNIDDILIPLTSYNYSRILSNNYDFLVNFALRYISDNKDIYQDYIYDNYHEYYYKNNMVDTYVDLNLVYDITDKFFNKRDFYVINKELDIRDDKISLLIINNKHFDLSLERITDIIKERNRLTFIANYSNKIKYKYTFLILDDNRLVIENIEL